MATEKSKRFGDQRKEESKKWQSISKNQTQIRKAKAFVISMMGEFTKTCQYKQVASKSYYLCFYLSLFSLFHSLSYKHLPKTVYLHK